MSPDLIARFGAPPAVEAFAPGRVNLIGDHTDYQAGFVLPAALVIGTSVALRPRADADEVIRVYSANQPAAGVMRFSLRQSSTAGDHGGWTAYVRAVGAALIEA